MLQTATTREWSYAAFLLAIVSLLFILLRVSGRAFVAPEFEMLVIYLPTVVSFLVYVAQRRFGLSSS